MKVLLVGSSKSWAIESHYKEHLAKHVDVSLFNSRDLFLASYSRSIFHKLAYRLRLYSPLNKINRQLYTAVVDYKPDIVWVFKGMEVYPETLKKIKLLDIKLVNYNADDPFEYTFSGSGNLNVKHSLSLYDLHFSYSKRILKRFDKELNIKSSWLPFAFEISKQPLKKIENSNIPCFIGNPDKTRAGLLKFLAHKGIKLHVYGIGWDKFLEHENIKISDGVLNEDLINTAQKYYCQINIFRPQNVTSHNMRTFEMPALGCVMFAPRSEEHESFFNEGEEAFFYDSKEDLLLQLKDFLRLSEDEKQAIANNAYKRSIDERYSYENRAEQVLASFKDL